MYDEGGKFAVDPTTEDRLRAEAEAKGLRYSGDVGIGPKFLEFVKNVPDAGYEFFVRGFEGLGELAIGTALAGYKGGKLLLEPDPEKRREIMAEPAFTKYMGEFRGKLGSIDLAENTISGITPEQIANVIGYYAGPPSSVIGGIVKAPFLAAKAAKGTKAAAEGTTNIVKDVANIITEGDSGFRASAGGAKVSLNNARNEIVTKLNKFFKNKNMDELTEADLDANIVNKIFTETFDKYDIARSGAIRSDTEYKRLYDAGLINDKLLSKITTYGNKLKSRQKKLDAGKVRKKKADLALSFLEGTQAANLNKPLLYKSLSQKYPDLFPVVGETRMREVIDELIEKRPTLSDYLGLKRKVDPDTLKPLKIDEKSAFKSYLTNNSTMKEVFKTFKDSDRTLVKSYLDMIRRSSPGSKKPTGENFDEFMSAYANEIQDLKNPNSVFYKNYKTFVNYENLRVSVQDDIKSVLDKIYKAPKKRPDGTTRTEAQRIKEAPNTVQIAHAFESSQIDKTIGQNKMKLGTQEVSTMEGAGRLPQSYYLDLSEFNSVRQPTIEAKLRKAIDKGDQQAIKEANIELEQIGAKVTINKKEYGRHKFLTEKLDEIEDKLLTTGKEFNKNNEYGITKQEYEKFKNGMEKLRSEVTSFQKKGIDVNMLKGGGLVGISHLTRPLGNF